MKPQCIQAVANALGRALTRAEADGIEARVRAALRAEFIRNPEFQGLSTQSRLLAAAKIAADQIVKEAADAKRQTVAQIAAHDRIGGDLQRMTAKGVDPQEALSRMLLDNADGKSEGMSLEMRAKAVTEDYRRRLTDSYEALGPKALGLFANVKGTRDFVFEMFGRDSGSPEAKKAAEVWRKTADAMTAHFRDAGGVLNRLADWRFPQHHDQTRVFEAGREAWMADVIDKLDRRRYVGDDGRLMNDAQLRDVLSTAWESISTGGANKIEPGKAGGAAKVANREKDHRVIHFRDPEGYLEYQAKYGGHDTWSTITGHVNHMAQSIALMEHFGPNADNEFAYWNQWAAKETPAKTKANANSRKLDDAYRALAGYSEGVTHPNVARAFDTARNVIVAARLGTAIMSSIPDVATMAMTARYNRVGALEALWNGIRLMNPANGEGRRELERLGLMVNSQLDAVRRFQVDSVGQSWSARMANAVLTASGLNHWTDGLRGGFASTMARSLAHLVGEHGTLASMGEDARVLRSKGVSETDFAVWKLAAPDETSFGDLLTPDAIYRIPDAALEGLGKPEALRREAAIKLLGVTLSESHMAVTEPGAKERLQMSTASPKGDIKGELLRSFWQFKTFPWAFFQKHMVQRGWNGSDTVGGRLAYIAPLILSSTVMGAIAMTVKDLLQGKDPRPLWNAEPKVLAKNWVAAFLQGGALGMYGDFLGGAATDSNRGAFSSALGPLAGTVDEGLTLTLGNAVDTLGNRPTHFGQEAVSFAKSLTPGSTLWYTKAATDHYLFNWLQNELNPGYLQRAQDRARREFGQSYWWRPNEAAPSRMANLSRIVGQQ